MIHNDSFTIIHPPQGEHGLGGGAAGAGLGESMLVEEIQVGAGRWAGQPLFFPASLHGEARQATHINTHLKEAEA